VAIISNDMTNATPFEVQDLGRLAYAPALARQRLIHQQVLAGQSPPTLLLVEHDPVITLSRSGSTAKHLLADKTQLALLGIDVQPTDRGGDITYHGPGQLVAYPILPLTCWGLNVGHYMRLLERVAIDTAATFAVTAIQLPRCVGVWVDGSPPRKLCALGVRVRKNVSLHGLAFNVAPDLTHYQTIVPCGLAGKGVTSLAQLLGLAAPAMEQVKPVLVDALRHQLDLAAAHRACNFS